MSQQITTAMVDMFSSNVMHLVQQEETRLLQYCRQETFNGESKFFDRIGATTVRRKEGRHSDIIFTDIEHSRRMLTTEDFYSADLVDKEDKLKVIMNPESEYVKAIGMAIARQIDESIIEGALGTAYSGKKGTTAVTLPDAQKIGAHNGTAFTGLNLKTLRAVRKLMKENEAIKKGQKLIFAMAAQQADDLLATTEIGSQDYNSVRALVDGEVSTFMGFKFVELQLLPFLAADITTFNAATGAVTGGAVTITAAQGRRCFAFVENSAVLCSMPSRVNGRIDERKDKHYAHQVYGSMTVGTTRMEEKQLIEVICKEL